MKHNPLELQLKTLTPLWTGGITTGTMDRVHEMSIIGSLRWWYEAIVRGLGADVCDTTSAGCTLDSQKYEDGKKVGLQDAELLTHAGLCPVCQLFGATGWRRRFRLRIDAAGCKPIWSTDTTNTRSRGHQHEWYLPPGYVGNLQMHIVGDTDAVSKVATLLRFLEEWGGLGAKQQLGYGRFAIVHWDGPDPKPLLFNFNTKKQHPHSEWKHNPLPNMQDFLFYRVQFRPSNPNWWKLIDRIRKLGIEKQGLEKQLQRGQGMIPISPIIKSTLRFQHPWPSREANAWFFGIALSRHRKRSNVCIGWAFQEHDYWCIPGWVWLPRDRQVRRDYASIKQHIQQLLQERSVWLQPLGLQGTIRSMHIVTKTGTDIVKELGIQKRIPL